jgi:NAD(P)-dependent dehydrogenase (short-subunit alcohol dehydrogenase family)
LPIRGRPHRQQHLGRPAGAEGPHSAAKAAAIALTDALTAELKEIGANVGVTVFCPGTARTNMSKSSRNRPAELSDTRAAEFRHPRPPVELYREPDA